MLTGGRFRFGVGTGEALNEHVSGRRGPMRSCGWRLLEEAVHVMRHLFTGKQITHRGWHYTVENAASTRSPMSRHPSSADGSPVLPRGRMTLPGRGTLG
ncbi:LLM class flavin-dependent oxidoreductase [Streptomyces sp. NPDC005279]|uniref:LLM class flavin-dependent oxidoreductase n=1 Tax=Streptomyces sp. NPDC005279 TaxID=3364712 RepID=UPI00368E2AA1